MTETLEDHAASEYFHLYPVSNLMCVPLTEARFLFHLPDLYHELPPVQRPLPNRARISRGVTPHTSATLFLQKGGSLAALSRILGHDRPETMAIYFNLTDMHALEKYGRKW